LDIGCGPGRQSLELARGSQGRLTALDIFQSSLTRLKAERDQSELQERIGLVRGSMTKLPFTDDHFDLIWSEGAIYCMGFEAGLKAWRRYLRPGGYLAVTELSWLDNEPTPQVRDFWQANYAPMSSVDENWRRILDAGYERVDGFTLPPEDWWDHFYRDLAAQVEAFADRFAGAERSIAEAVVKQTELEMEILRKGEGAYSYVFYIMRKPL
jgi:ubiquinone/menaquinone biosynthesis C-methylase UbiE